MVFLNIIPTDFYDLIFFINFPTGLLNFKLGAIFISNYSYITIVKEGFY